MAFDTIEAGEVFGFLTAIEPVRKTKGKMYWRFKCACGEECVTRSQSAKTGRAKTCGCRGRPRASSSDNKICSKCGVEKSREEFTRRKDGKLWGACKKCSYADHSQYLSKRRKVDRSYVLAVAANTRRSRSKPDGRLGVMFRALRAGAKKRGIIFAIQKSDIKALADRQQWRCAKTGLPLDLTMGKGQLPFGPTIDRIDSERGYEIGNIQLVCYMYNTSKNRFTDEDVLRFAEALLNNSRSANMFGRAA